MNKINGGKNLKFYGKKIFFENDSKPNKIKNQNQIKATSHSKHFKWFSKWNI